jgi:carbon storage regulator
MLVLSRRERERIKLGDSIVVTVVRVAGDKVRLGIEAPADMLVLRDELDVHPRGSEPAKATRPTAPQPIQRSAAAALKKTA